MCPLATWCEVLEAKIVVLMRGKQNNGARNSKALAATLVALAVIAGSGCVTVTLYEPMGVLQRPTLVVPATSTFERTRVQVRCLPGSDMPSGDAEKVCRLVSASLRGQGAETETVVPRQLEDSPPSLAFDGAGADLSIEIESATEHHYDHPFLGVVSCLTLTLVPSFAEETYRSQVVVRGRNQTILAEDTLRARFVTYNGVLLWAANYVADWLFRDDDNDVSGDLGLKDFSRDYYGQIAQLTYNARVRSELLGLTARAQPLAAVLPITAPAPTTPAPTTPAPAPAPATTTAPTPTAAPPPPPPLDEPPAPLGAP